MNFDTQLVHIRPSAHILATAPAKHRKRMATQRSLPRLADAKESAKGLFSPAWQYECIIKSYEIYNIQIMYTYNILQSNSKVNTCKYILSIKTNTVSLRKLVLSICKCVVPAVPGDQHFVHKAMTLVLRLVFDCATLFLSLVTFKSAKPGCCRSGNSTSLINVCYKV